MVDRLSIEQQILCSQLENYSLQIKNAYLGAIHALHTEDYEDRLVHFAHSLREVIYMLMKKNLPKEKRTKPLKKENKIPSLAATIDPGGKQVYGFESRYERLIQEYEALSEVAHHGSELDQENAKKHLATVEEFLSYLTRSQIEILEEMDEIMSLVPSKEGADRLKPCLFRWSSHSYLLDNLSCEWLQPLDDVGFFDNPQPLLDRKSGGFPYWMPSGYLVKCVDSMPELVTKIILKCKFKTQDERNPAIYNDFLKCSIELPEKYMEKIVQKATKEKWHDFISNYFIAEKYADLAERLYLAGKYNVALNMIAHILNSANTDDSRSQINYGIEDILNKKIPQFVEKNPSGIIKLLVSYLGNIIKRSMVFESSDLSHQFLRAIEDHEQNNYKVFTIPAVCIIHLRNCLIRLGDTKPRELKANMNMLGEKKFYIFRRLELFLYGQFPKLFGDEIERSLIEFFDVDQVHHEYYHLLKNAFGKLDDSMQKQILSLIKSGAQKIFDKNREKNSEDYAIKQANVWMLRKMEPIHNHLKDEDKGQYERLAKELGTLVHPDFDDQYFEGLIRYESSKSESFSGKAVDEVLAIVTEYKPDPNIMPHADESIRSFENFVINNLSECSKKASKILDLDPRMQHAFLSAIERTSKKKYVDWNSIVTLIEHLVISISYGTHHSSMFDPILDSCRIINEGLREYRIDYALKERIWALVQRFIKLSNARDDISEKYSSHAMDSPTVSLNNIEGVSFHTFFQYIRWCYHNEKSKDVFTVDVKKVLKDYLNDKHGHTISRHAAIGMHMDTMFRFDPEWTECIMLPKIFSNKDNKVAFWESYVLHNQAQHNTLLRLHALYDQFLNKKITKDMHKKEFYHSTIDHVTLGYLYCVKHFDEIFKRFISNAEPESINHCGFFITRVLSKNPDVAEFKDKIIKLWTIQTFIDHADLGTWFTRSPLNQKESIELFLNYLRCHVGELNPTSFPFEELDKNIDKFPDHVAKCIQNYVDRPSSKYFPDTLKPILKKLLDKKMSAVTKICECIINELLSRGYNDYRDLL